MTTQRKLFAFANMNTGLYASAGLSCSEVTLADPPAYSATSLASASILYNNWFAQSKPGQLFGLQGKYNQTKFICAYTYIYVYVNSTCRNCVENLSDKLCNVALYFYYGIQKILTYQMFFFFVYIYIYIREVWKQFHLLMIKDSNYLFVITYRRNSIFANNAEKILPWFKGNIGDYSRRL